MRGMIPAASPAGIDRRNLPRNFQYTNALPRLVTSRFLLNRTISDSEGSVRTGWEPRGTFNRVTHVMKDIVEFFIIALLI